MANTSRKWYNFVLKKDNIAETSDLVLKSPISINEQCNTDVKLNGNKTWHSLANRLKIAAIYDDIQAIINILSVNSNKESKYFNTAFNVIFYEFNILNFLLSSKITF